VDDRRSDGRQPTYKAGTIRIGSVSRSVVVLNLSTGGAMIDGTDPLEEDAVLTFESTDTGAVTARVAWVLGKRCGLTFDHVVDLAGHQDVAA
jgi:PilZ domain